MGSEVRYVVVEFSVPFVAGLDRARVTTRGGYVHEYDTKKNRDNKQVIADAYEEACMAKYGEVLVAPRRTPVRVTVDVYDALPKSRPKRVENEPNTFGCDVDNHVKLGFDALNGVAWDDDVQVVKVVAEKRDRTRGVTPHMDITVAGSSRKRIIGSPMERMSRFLRSFRPPTQSITANVLMS